MLQDFQRLHSEDTPAGLNSFHPRPPIASMQELPVQIATTRSFKESRLRVLTGIGTAGGEAQVHNGSLGRA